MAPILLCVGEMSAERLLTLDCHEAWVYQLGYLGFEIDIIEGLPGRFCSRWDTRMRSVPRGANLVTLEKVLTARPSYHCIIAHNITDLLDVKTLSGPRMLVFHETLDGRIRQQGVSMLAHQVRLLVRHYLELTGAHPVAISPLKARSWGFIDDVVQNSINVVDYPSWQGDIAAGLRVSNQISNRKEILLWDFHEAAFRGINVRLVGFNPDLPGVLPSESWEELKSILSSHRFFVHTAHPELEDGYNMAVLEAMAAGLPVLGNRHPSSPIEHGVSGFLSDDPEELGRYGRLLLREKDLAGRMGEAARKTAAERFGVDQFVTRFRKSIEAAQEKWRTRRLPDEHFSLSLSGQDEALDLLGRSGFFLRLSHVFQDHVRSLELEWAIDVLDEILKHLGMSRDQCISNLDDLIRIAIHVSDKLTGLEETRAAECILRSALGLIQVNSTLPPQTAV